MTTEQPTTVPQPPERRSLDELLSRVTPENVHLGTETGHAVRRESW